MQVKAQQCNWSPWEANINHRMLMPEGPGECPLSSPCFLERRWRGARPRWVTAPPTPPRHTVGLTEISWAHWPSHGLHYRKGIAGENRNLEEGTRFSSETWPGAALLSRTAQRQRLGKMLLWEVLAWGSQEEETDPLETPKKKWTQGCCQNFTLKVVNRLSLGVLAI